MVRRVSKTQEETEMARRGENIHKRKDGRWEGRYIKAHTPEENQWGYVYGTVYAEVKRTDSKESRGRLLQSKENRPDL